jgi:acetyl esterase/lipase
LIGNSHHAIPADLQDLLDSFNKRKQILLERGFRYTPTNAREAMEKLTRHYVTQIPELPFVHDDLIPGPDYQVPVRIYHPRPRDVLPVAVFAHGGGHVGGSVSVYDPIARNLAIAMQRLVLSVDYRLAPECPYPAALKDLLAVVKGAYRLLDNLDLGYAPRMALIGDSGGGALCATLSHRCQFDPAVNIDRQVLIYPSVDYSLSCPSVNDNGEGYMLERDRILWLFDCYFQHAEDRRERSPLYMPITPDYPRTLVITAEYCPLRDEGIAYAKRLTEAGIVCEQHTFDGMVHAFLNLEDVVPKQCDLLYQLLQRFC